MTSHSEADYGSQRLEEFFKKIERWFRRRLPVAPDAPKIEAPPADKPKEPARFWGHNPDGTPYLTGMKVGELKALLSTAPDDSELCMVIRRKNGGQVATGKPVSFFAGSNVWNGMPPSQTWIEGRVLDPSQE